jgi:hypothetical protein
MAQSIPIVDGPILAAWAARLPKAVLWLQGITLAWMLVECAVSSYAATVAHSVVLLAFGADSFVELLSASVAFFSLVPSFPLTKDRAARWPGFCSICLPLWWSL